MVSKETKDAGVIDFLQGIASHLLPEYVKKYGITLLSEEDATYFSPQGH